jgi:glycosyltransferase involved in cell wall biosynthesis
MDNIIPNINHWFYLAEKNIAHLAGLKNISDKITKIKNGYPLDNNEFPKTRHDLGIEDNAFVFAVASRAIKEKGWLEAIEALRIARSKTKRKLYILFAGDGDYLEHLTFKYKNEPGIIFLGFQSAINGLYRISDCALLPTRFKGESFPLALIQAMQIGLPIISTDIGEIPKMIIEGEAASGLLVPYSEEDEKYINNLSLAMLEILSPQLMSKLSSTSLVFGQSYDISAIAKEYSDFYKRYFLL